MQQSLNGMTSHAVVALAAKTWLKYGKGMKWYQSLKLAWLRHTIYSNFVNNAKT